MARKKGALGRGLGALIPTSESETGAPEGPAAGGSLREVAVASILPNPHQPRTNMDSAALEELAASIREHGLIQPLIVTQIEDGAIGERFQLIAGERRWRAARRVGLEAVPVVVKEATPQAMLELALIENIQREDLSALEEAEAYRHLVEDFGLTHDEVARRVGKSRPAVTNTLRLLTLPEPIHNLLLDGTSSAGQARALASLDKASQMMDVLEVVQRRGLNVRMTEALVKAVRAGRPLSRSLSPLPAPSPSDTAVEARFRDALGAKVSLKRGRRGGTLTIHFKDDEDLQHLYEVIASADEK
ncbi:MAG TPA: ParB/RepB/Spo0J family partition protein [Ardenticatenaceae bacterium]|nr:ParB/RepB/Spo0J family partition protein [Ardenticatenaceae bacterium]